jgi:hypothetical protein
VQAIADGEVAIGINGLDPIASNQLTAAEIKRCEADPAARLHLTIPDLPITVSRSKGPRYTPVTKRGDKPDGIAYLVKNYPELSDNQISQLIGTTKDTIKRVRERTHWNTSNIKARSPVSLGLTSQRELDAALAAAHRSGAKPPAENPAAAYEEVEALPG